MNAKEVLIGRLAPVCAEEEELTCCCPSFSSSSSFNGSSCDSRRFPSKVGGFPAWLDPCHLPDNINCTSCEEPMTFLLQIYAPQPYTPPSSFSSSSTNDDDNRYHHKRRRSSPTFHRTLFLFVCMSCGGGSSMRLFRSQLPRDNLYYPYHPFEGEEGGRKNNIITNQHTSTTPNQLLVMTNLQCCQKCGLPCPLDNRLQLDQIDTFVHCTGCYGVFPEYRLDVEEEMSESESHHHQQTTTTYLAELKRKEEDYQKRAKNHPEEDLLDESELEAFQQLANKGRGGGGPSSRVSLDEIMFDRFLERCRRHPSHVLRYAYRGTPLWIAASAKLPSSSSSSTSSSTTTTTSKGRDNSAGHHNKSNRVVVPPCQNCGQARVFECQVQPHLIYAVDRAHTICFGIVVLYTCSSNCCFRSWPAKPYHTTTIHNQDQDQEGTTTTTEVYKQMHHNRQIHQRTEKVDTRQSTNGEGGQDNNRRDTLPTTLEDHTKESYEHMGTGGRGGGGGYVEEFVYIQPNVFDLHPTPKTGG